MSINLSPKQLLQIGSTEGKEGAVISMVFEQAPNPLVEERVEWAVLMSESYPALLKGNREAEERLRRCVLSPQP